MMLLWACSSPMPQVSRPAGSTPSPEVPTADGAGCLPAPDPPCPPIHLGTAGIPSPGAIACESRADCPPEQFCGAGTCRSVDDEWVTLCLEQVSWEGALCDPTVPLRVFAGVEGSYYDVVWDIPASDNVCVRRLEQCKLVELSILTDDGARVSIVQGVSREGPSGVATFDLYGRQWVMDHIDQGCLTMEKSTHPFRQSKAKATWSVWYP